MTQRKTSSRRYSGANRMAQARMRDLANSFACTSDPAVLSAIDNAVSACLEDLYRNQERRQGRAELWTDGSYNARANAAGIGILARIPGKPDTAMGKSVRAADSQEAEIYAMAVGLSYLLDTCPGIKSVLVRYDCAAAAVSAANIDAYAGRGAPYTNFRSAMKRARKSGMTVLFRHVKAHAGHAGNETCDLLARHYAKAQLEPAQLAAITPYLKPARNRRIPE